MTTTAILYPVHQDSNGTVTKEETPDYTRYHAYDPTGNTWDGLRPISGLLII